MIDAELVVRTVFSGLAALAIDAVEDLGEMIVVRACTRGGAVQCPTCGTPTRHVHAFHERLPADVPIDGRRVLIRVRVRRMRCRAQHCARQTFREQVPGVLERYQRHTVRPNEQLRGVVRELAGRASARLLPVLGISAGKDTALRVLLSIALPERPVPRVLGIDDFALRRSRQHATVLIDVDSGVRVDVLPGRGAGVVTDWLREHPGVEVVCRDGSNTYAQAVRDAIPHPVQVADRGTCGTDWPKQQPEMSRRTRPVGLEQPGSRTVRWPAPRPSAGIRSTRLLKQGLGLLECSQRLNLSLNTVKRYARASGPYSSQLLVLSGRRSSPCVRCCSIFSHPASAIDPEKCGLLLTRCVSQV